jgi:thymidylate synthase (FAD)
MTIFDKKFPVLDKGWIMLVDVMGSDQAIVDAARVSYGEGTKHTSDNETLIRYLMRHRHTTPFEMCELKFCVQVPMDCWRQWIRHRTANVNECSTRYSEAIDEMQTTDPDKWRLQDRSNKQGSSGYVEEWPNGDIDLTDPKGDLSFIGPGDHLSNREISLHKDSRDVYEERLKLGVAREQARKDLPLSTYTKAYWKIDLHNLLHFLGLRMDEHAQLEIRSYANIIGNEIVANLFPITWNAFCDYRLGAMMLSAKDISAIQGMLLTGDTYEVVNTVFSNNREKKECLKKLVRLGFTIEI